MKTRSPGSLSTGDKDMSAYSHDQLVLEAMGDSQQAFAELVQQYQHRVLRTIASIIRDEQAAQDMAQETFLSAWSNLAKLKQREKFGIWLNQIAINLAKDWLKDQRKRQEKIVFAAEDVVLRIPEPEYQSEKLRQEVWDAIDGLAGDHREVVILHYISGYSYKEIGDMLSIPTSTIVGRLQKARNQLRKEFVDMVTKLQLEIDSTVHKFLKEHAKQNGVSIEGLIIRLIERYKRDIDKPEVTVRQVWEPSREPILSDSSGAPSPDGRYLSFTEWYSANLAVRDLTTGEYRELTDEGTWDGPDQWAGGSIWSPDGKQIAYAWWNVDHWELRIVGFDGSEPRVLSCDEEMKRGHPNGIRPCTWSQDGAYILAWFRKAILTILPKVAQQIVLVSVADGSVRVLKSLEGTISRYYFTRNMSLSPDGSYVVYGRPVEENGGGCDIFLLATDGSGETSLVEHPADDCEPVWAPDGKAIVFVSDRSGTYDAWLMHVVDGKPVGEPQLVKRDTGPMKPMGFTRGGCLYYSLGYSSNDVYVASIDPTTGHLLSPPTKAISQFEGFNGTPVWSPDGKSLLYISHRPSPGSFGRRRVLVIRSLETGEERELIPKTSVRLGNLRWSPDGRSILCGRSLQLIDAQTGDVTPIVPYEQFPPNGPPSRDSVWSSDGKAIFYLKITEEYPLSIVMHDLETGKEKELWQEGVHGVGLGISPDGRQLVFGKRGKHYKTLMVMTVEGGEPRILHRLQEGEFAFDCSPTWAADGRYVIFGKRDPDELWCIPAEGGEPQKLLAMEGLRNISVHPDGRRIAFACYLWNDQVWTMENFLSGFTAAR